MTAVFQGVEGLREVDGQSEPSAAANGQLERREHVSTV
jgi:hypothetical protein